MALQCIETSLQDDMFDSEKIYTSQRVAGVNFFLTLASISHIICVYYMKGRVLHYAAFTEIGFCAKDVCIVGVYC